MATQDKPAQYPRWASNPPTPPPTTITEPTSAQKDSGWQPPGSAEFPDGKPVREFANWLENLAYQWIQWLDRVTHRSNDLSPDHALPGYGSTPSIGAGLSIADGDFSARVFVDGYELGSIAAEFVGASYSYTDNSDTYWDLQRDGLWVPVVVANGAPEPAVTANSVRVYVVETIAGARTQVLSDRREEFLNIDKTIELVWGSENDTDRAVPRFLFKWQGDGAIRYTQIAESRRIQANSYSHRIYISDNLGSIVYCVGAAWNPGTAQWDPDPGSFPSADFWIWNIQGMHAISVAHLGASFPDTKITDLPGTHADVFDSWITRSSFRAGNAINVSQAEDVAAFRSNSPGVGAHRHRRLCEFDSLNLYSLDKAAHGTDGNEGRGGFFTSNCEWDNATQKWEQLSAGADSYKLTIDKDGWRLFLHRDADGATWDDVTSPNTNWREVETFGSRTKRLIVPASEGIWTTGSPITVATGAPGSMDDPVDNAGEVGALRAITTGVPDKSAIFPLHLPQGSVVTAVTLEGGFNTPAAEQIRVALVRFDGIGNTRTSFRSGTAYDVITGTGTATKVLKPLTIDAAEAIRTIDNLNYSYYLWIGEQAGDLNHTWSLSRWIVEFKDA